LRKNLFRGVGCNLIKETKKRRKTSHPKSTAKSRIWGTKTPEPIDTKFYISGDVHDIIMHADFGEKSAKGFWCGDGSILAFFH